MSNFSRVNETGIQYLLSVEENIHSQKLNSHFSYVLRITLPLSFFEPVTNSLPHRNFCSSCYILLVHLYPIIFLLHKAQDANAHFNASILRQIEGPSLIC